MDETCCAALTSSLSSFYFYLRLCFFTDSLSPFTSVPFCQLLFRSPFVLVSFQPYLFRSKILSRLRIEWVRFLFLFLQFRSAKYASTKLGVVSSRKFTNFLHVFISDPAFCGFTVMKFISIFLAYSLTWNIPAFRLVFKEGVYITLACRCVGETRFRFRGFPRWSMTLLDVRVFAHTFAYFLNVHFLPVSDYKLISESTQNDKSRDKNFRSIDRILQKKKQNKKEKMIATFLSGRFHNNFLMRIIEIETSKVDSQEFHSSSQSMMTGFSRIMIDRTNIVPRNKTVD